MRAIFFISLPLCIGQNALMPFSVALCGSANGRTLAKRSCISVLSVVKAVKNTGTTENSQRNTHREHREVQNVLHILL